MKEKIKEIMNKPKSKYVFLSSCIIMFITHIYMYTNMILNHDSVNYYLTGEDMEYYFGCGRWLLWLITRFSGIQTLTPVIALISVVAVSASCCLLIDLFKIENKWLIICFNILVATFPAVSNSFCYMYNADGIFIAYFLAVFSVWLLNQEKKSGTIAAFIILILACGIYQLYWSMSVGLAYTVIMLRLINKESKEKFYKVIVRHLAVYGGSIIAYLALNKIILRLADIEMAGYAGLDSMLEFGGLQDIIDIVYLANIQVFQFFTGSGYFIPNIWITMINFILLGFGVCYCVYKMSKCKKADILFICGMVCFMPSVLNNVSIAGKGYLHSVMMMPFIIPYFFILACMDDMLSKKEGGVYVKFISRIIVLALLFLGYNNFLITNKVYARQELNYEATYSYLSRMLMRIEETAAYGENPQIEICFINEIPSEKFHIDILEENPSVKQGIFDEGNNMISTNDRTFVKNLKDVYDFYDKFLGVGLTRVSDEKYLSIGESSQFKEMPVYPQNGSIQVIDGVLTVKMKNADK